METYVCGDCVDDYAVKQFIKHHAEELRCDYCRQTSQELPIGAAVNDVGDFILEGLEMEWSHPEDEAVAWDSEDGCYVVSTVDSYDLVDRYFALESDQLRNDLANQLGDNDWCQRNPYRLTREESWIFDWEQFSEELKHQTRYVFFRVKNERDEYGEGVQNLHEIMDEIATIVLEIGLIRTISSGTVITRARPHCEIQQYSTVEDLGPPSKELAIHANRMSPSGIPMFYGSDSELTALSEVEQTGFATLAQFVTQRAFKVLDLTRIPDVPSIFDRQPHYERAPLIFLRNFLADLTKRVAKDGREHIEYVPTQVITEYFRRVFLDQDHERVKGIIYPSARNESGISYVLFFDNNNCTQDDRNVGTGHWLSMVTRSVRRVDRRDF